MNQRGVTLLTICVEGLHISLITAYCNHNNDYGKTFAVIGECDGSCKAEYKEPTADDLVWRPAPEHVQVSDVVISTLLNLHSSGSRPSRVEVPRS